MTTRARARWEAVDASSSREEYFEALRDVLAEYYLADPDDPYRQSGRGRGADRWRESRHCHVEAIDRDGSYCDVGCANGLLLETLHDWAAERGFRLDLHGVDFIPELVALARARHPELPAEHFQEANAFHWEPERRYDYVHVNVECVPERDRPELIHRMLVRAVAPRGRLIVSFYYPSAEEGKPQPDPADLLRELRLPVSGTARAVGTLLAWTDRSAGS